MAKKNILSRIFGSNKPADDCCSVNIVAEEEGTSQQPETASIQSPESTSQNTN